MSHTSVYYVPVDQKSWLGRSDELAERLWEHGVFLETPIIMNRLEKFSREKLPLPKCSLEIEQAFGFIGVADEPDEEPVPNDLYAIKCPKCGHDLYDLAYEAWSVESDLALTERTVECPSCNLISSSKYLKYDEPMEFARFYVFVGDCVQEEWDPNFRKLLEEIVGPCHEYWEDRS